jgi:hypothetical protein
MPYLRRRSSSDLRASVGLEDMRLPSSDTEPISIGTFFDISEPDNAKVRVMDGKLRVRGQKLALPEFEHMGKAARTRRALRRAVCAERCYQRTPGLRFRRLMQASELGVRFVETPPNAARRRRAERDQTR